MLNAKKSLAQRGWLLAILVGVTLTLAACSTEEDQVPAANGTATFEFSVDPTAQTVTLAQPNKGLSPQQETAPGEARVLLQGQEIILASL